LRASLSLAVMTLALAGPSAGALAQYYYPPPPPPPGYVGGPGYPQSYSSAPLPPPGDPRAIPPSGVPNGPPAYRDANGMPYEPDDDRPVRVPNQYPPPGYSPPPGYYAQPRPDIASRDGMAPQPMPSLGGAPIDRPPGNVGDTSAPADITGSVRGPAAPPQAGDRSSVFAALPPEDRPEQGPTKELPPNLRRQLVDYVTKEPAGTIVIDTPNTYLYLVLGDGKAVRYGIGVGREGFTWAGTERISRMSEWPDWHPPAEMIERQPYLPRFMAGGEGNPLGARALYLGSTLYRIHGTNQPSTIGTFVSSGCIRLTNDDISDLYSRVSVGTRVVVLPGSPPATASSAPTPVAAQAPVAR
jgi:lipoprotein-anchoring transpeptidase ErfK/SrfK